MRRAATITLRVNPGFGHGHSQKTNTGGEQSKHGIWHEQIGECLRPAPSATACTITGLHMHIGSGTDLEHLAQVCGAMERVGRPGRPIDHDDQRRRRPADRPIGPTIARRSRRPTSACGTPTRKRLEDAFGHPVRLEIEPGRYLVAESGYLVAEIRAVKRMGDNTFYLLDAGFNNLARPILYGAYHPMSIVPGRRLIPRGREQPTWSSAARCASRATSSRRRRAASSHAALARRPGGRVAGDRARRCLRLRDGLELQHEAAGGRGAHCRRRPRPPDPPPADV